MCRVGYRVCVVFNSRCLHVCTWGTFAITPEKPWALKLSHTHTHIVPKPHPALSNYPRIATDVTVKAGEIDSFIMLTFCHVFNMSCHMCGATAGIWTKVNSFTGFLSACLGEKNGFAGRTIGFLLLLFFFLRLTNVQLGRIPNDSQIHSICRLCRIKIRIDARCGLLFNKRSTMWWSCASPSYCRIKMNYLSL